MDKQRQLARIPAVLLIVGSVIGVLFWLVMVFFAFFLGGATGPPNFERTVPLPYVAVIALGLVGALVGLGAGIKSLRNAPVSRMVALSALLGAVGSASFFLLELFEMGLMALLVGVVPPIICLSLARLLRRV